MSVHTIEVIIKLLDTVVDEDACERNANVAKNPLSDKYTDMLTFYLIAKKAQTLASYVLQ